jgi:hypothetical protein
MIEFGGGFGLAQQPLTVLFLGGVKEFDGDGSLEFAVPGFPDFAGPAGAQRR